MEIIQTNPEITKVITDTNDKSHELMRLFYTNYKKHYIQLQRINCLESPDARMQSNISSFYSSTKVLTNYGKLAEKIKFYMK